MNSNPHLLRTALCDLLGIVHPVVQAPMAGVVTPALAAAVSNAGGLGQLGAARMSPAQLAEAIRTVRSLTDRPFGVNFILAPPEPGGRELGQMQPCLDEIRGVLHVPAGRRERALPPSFLAEQLRVAIDAAVPVVSFGLGDPRALLPTIRQSGAKVLAMVTTVEEARQVVDSGVDVVVAQGAEAGGHRSTFRLDPAKPLPLVGTLALVPQVVDAVNVPVVAAGGIMDGRGLAAALALGAAGAQLGTRFIVCRESGAFAGYQERLLQTTEVETEVTALFTGRPARSVTNEFVRRCRHAGVEPLPWPMQALAAEDIYRAAESKNEPEYYPLLAGQGLRMLKRGQGAADIVREVAGQARNVLVRLGRMEGSG